MGAVSRTLDSQTPYSPAMERASRESGTEVLEISSTCRSENHAGSTKGLGQYHLCTIARDCRFRDSASRSIEFTQI